MGNEGGDGKAHIIISGKHRELSNYGKQIYYLNPWREEPRKFYHYI